MKISIGIELVVNDIAYKISIGNWKWGLGGQNYKLSMGIIVYVYWFGPFRLSVTPQKSAMVA